MHQGLEKSALQSEAAMQTRRLSPAPLFPEPKILEIFLMGDMDQAIPILPVPWWKQALDLTVATLALLFLLPQFLLIAIGIKLDSEGPILFKQLRSGHGGKPFWIYKFRTMVPNAASQQEGLLHLNERNGPAFKMRNDPRVTRFGRFLRKTKLDETPQFLNVLRGEMSLVGPRPLDVEEMRKCAPWQLRRLEVRPGLTGVWQVYGQDSPCFETWMRQDIAYAESISFWSDLKLLLLTVPTVLRFRGL